jgi:transposase-like protein
MGDYSNNNRDYNNQGSCLAKIIRILIICTIRADYFCQTGPKPLAERQSFYALQLARHDLTPITTTTIDGLLAQFKSNVPAELDSDSDSHDMRRRSYTREQKLAAISYAATKRVWDLKEEQMVLISHKQASKDLGIQPCQLRKWQKDVNKIRSLQKGSRKGKLSHPAQFPVLEDRLHALILEKRQLGRRVGENWIRRNARLEFERLWPERVSIVEKKKVFAGMAFSNGWFTGFLRRKQLSLRQPTKRARVVPGDYKDKITSWLQFNRRAQAKFNFELSEIANMDQTPISFEFLDNKTYDTTGAGSVATYATTQGLRTLHLVRMPQVRVYACCHLSRYIVSVMSCTLVLSPQLSLPYSIVNITLSFTLITDYDLRIP